MPEGATSLAGHVAATRLEVLDRLLGSLEHWLGQVDRHEDVLAAWRERDVTVGRPVRVRATNGVIEGMALAIDSDGSLVMARPNGVRVRISTGDVELLGQG